jgi:DnaK suppressor protein
MAKSKRGAKRRGDGNAGSPAKKTGTAKKTAAKPARKTAAAAKPSVKKAKTVPAVKHKSVASKKVARTRTRTAKPASKAPAAKKASRPQPPKKPSKSRAAKKAAVSRQSAISKAVSVPEAPVVSNADVAAQESRHRSAPRKRVHQRPTGGVAARLSAGGGDEQTITREDGRYALPATVNIDLPAGYRPSAKEEYMNPKQLAYFRQKLKDWRDQLVEESRQTMENLREEVRDVGDDAERATRETENSLELRTRDRYRKLISKIEKAWRKIEEGRYGFCEETDEEIGLDRLEARPIATLSLDAQERREHLQKQMGD